MEEKSACLYKLLVIGVIVLFIGVGVQPAIANNLDNINDVSKDNSIPITKGIRENSNCFIMGWVVDTKKIFSILQDENHNSGPFNKSLGFGFKYAGQEVYATGQIYTKGAQGEWDYSGYFIGGFGLNIIYHIGVKGFHGFCLGGLSLFPPHISIFIGFAEKVRIKT